MQKESVSKQRNTHIFDPKTPSFKVVSVWVGGVAAHLFLGLEPLVLNWRSARSNAAQPKIMTGYKSHRLGLKEDLQRFRRICILIHALFSFERHL